MKFQRTSLSMAALGAMLDAAGAHALTLFNDADMSIQALQDKLINLNQAAQDIRNKADAEGREFNADEEKELDNIQAAFEDTEANIQRRERVANMQARLAAPAGRQTNPEQVENAAAGVAAAAAPTSVARTAQRNSLPAQPRMEDKGKHGFLSAGDFLMAVVRSSAKGGVPDPRLTRNAAPGSYGSEGSGGDGGFAVPPDFRTAIMEKVMGVDALLPMTDNQTTSSNGMSFPVDETTPWQSTGGIQAYWDGEGQLKIPSKPSLGSKTIKMNKVIALVPLTDELLEDAPAMSSYVNRKAPEKINYKVNEAIIRGTGVGMPLGILNSPGTVVVPAESGQAAGTVVFQNIMKLWSSLDPVARMNAKWFMNPDDEAQIMSMQFPGTGTAVPVYLPPGGLANSPYGTLLGKPVMPQYACSALGLQGDIIFGDLKNYLTVTKQGGIKTDTSIHIWFDYDITAFRFVLRVGGEPWWNAGIVPAQSGAVTRGYFATLAARP